MILSMMFFKNTRGEELSAIHVQSVWNNFISLHVAYVTSWPVSFCCDSWETIWKCKSISLQAVRAFCRTAHVDPANKSVVSRYLKWHNVAECAVACHLPFYNSLCLKMRASISRILKNTKVCARWSKQEHVLRGDCLDIIRVWAKLHQMC